MRHSPHHTALPLLGLCQLLPGAAERVASAERQRRLDEIAEERRVKAVPVFEDRARAAYSKPVEIKGFAQAFDIIDEVF